MPLALLGTSDTSVVLSHQKSTRGKGVRDGRRGKVMELCQSQPHASFVMGILNLSDFSHDMQRVAENELS